MLHRAASSDHGWKAPAGSNRTDAGRVHSSVTVAERSASAAAPMWCGRQMGMFASAARARVTVAKRRRPWRPQLVIEDVYHFDGTTRVVQQRFRAPSGCRALRAEPG
jgi:hypothetical protein